MSQYVADTLRRGQSGAGTFPVVEQPDISVGYIVEADLTALQNIPSWRRRSKMKGFAITQNKTYELQSDLTTWTDVTVTVPGNIVISTDLFDINGFIKPSLIQSIYATQSFVAANQAAMLALTTLTGNIVVRTDNGHVYLKLNNAFPSLITDFADITSNVGAVTSVNGMTGAVTVSVASLLAVPQNVTDFNAQVAIAPAVASNTSAVSTLQGQMTTLQAYVPTHLGAQPLSALAQAPTALQIGYSVIWDGTAYTLSNVSGGGGGGGGGWAVTGLTTLTGDVTIDHAGNIVNFKGAQVRNFNGTAAVDTASQKSSFGSSYQTSLWTGAVPTTGYFTWRANANVAVNQGQDLTLYANVGATATFASPIMKFSSIGAQYSADYSGSYTVRSLVDQGYVLGLTGATGAWTLASGGTLTGNNTVAGGFAIDFTISRFNIVQTAQSSAWAKAFNVTPGNHTAMTLGTEFLGIGTNVAAFTQQWATGALAQQRWNYFGAPTIAFVGASTLTNAYNVYIERPVAGTNATITNNFALGMNGPLISTVGSSQLGTATNTARLGINTSPTGGVLNVLGTAGLSAISIQSSSTAGMFSIDDGAGILAGSTTFATTSKLTMRGATLLTGNVQTSAWLNTLDVTSGAHTGLTLSTEFAGLTFRVGASTQQWATGALTTQRWNIINSPTIAFVGASTLTNAYNLYVDAPVAGTNATITNNYSLGVAGQAYIFNTTASATSLVLDSNNGAASVWMRFTTGQRAAEYGRFQVGGNSVDYIGGQFRMNFTGVNSNWTQSNNPTGWEPAFTWQAGTHTGITASTEKPMFTVGTVTNQWATGALTIQRNFWIKAPTYGFIGASTLTDAYNLYVDPPVAGTNATFTRTWGIGSTGNIASIGASNKIGIDAGSGSLQGLKGGGTGLKIGSVGALGAGFGVDFVDNGDSVTYASFTSSGSGTGNFAFGSSTLTNAGFYINTATSAAGKTGFRFDPGAHTAITTATELNAVDFRGATQTWASGTVGTQRFNYFRGFTVAGVTPTATFTNTYTVYIESSTAGTNAAITNNYALGVNGNALFSGTPRVGIGAFNINSALNVIAISGQAGLTVYENSGSATMFTALNNGGVAVGSVAFANVTSGLSVAGFNSITGLSLALAAPYSVLVVKPGAYTTIGNTTEVIDFDFGSPSSVTQTWAGSGTVATNRTTYFRGRTLAGAAAQTWTNAYTVYIDPPVAGTNGTITNNYALGVAGSSIFTQTTGQPTVFISNTSSGAINASFDARAIFGSAMQFGGQGLAIAGQTGSAIGNVAMLKLTGGTLSAQTASTELTDAMFDFSRTVTWATGAITNQRSMWIKGINIAFAAASTVTSAYSLYIDPPVAGTNATLTNTFGLGVNGKSALIGQTYIGGVSSSTGASDILQILGNFSIHISNGVSGVRILTSGNDAYLDAPQSTGGINFRTNGSTQGAAVTGLQNFNIGATTASTNVAKLYVQQAVLTSAWLPALRLDPGAHTGMTLSTEFPNVVINTVTQQWATGALTTQRSVWVKSPTIGFVGASTLTDAYNLYIDPPVAGTNATITNTWALGLNGGLKVVFAGTATQPFMRITAGVVLTTIAGAVQDGAFEYTGTHLNFIIGSTRYQLDQQATGVLTCDVTMTAAQVTNSFSSPVQLIAAPGAGKAIYILSQPLMKYHFVTTAFTTGNNMIIAIGTGNVSNVIAGTVLTNTSDQYQNFGANQWTGAATAVENQACNFAFLTANPTGGGTSTVRITFQYIIVTL